MKLSDYKKISINEMHGLIKEEIFNLLSSSFFEDPIFFVKSTGGEVIKDSKYRWAGIFLFSPNYRIFLKRDITKGLIELLKYLILPSKGRKEWLVSYQMEKRNIPIPKPLGWLERIHNGFVIESYYLSEAIVSGNSLIENMYLLKDEGIFSELVKVLLKLHKEGFYHKDLHAGNLIWDGKSFFILDLHRVRLLNSLSLNQRLFNIATLFHSLRAVLEEREQLKFLEEYFKKGKINLNRIDYLNKIHTYMNRLQNRQWESRTKRCLKESTNFVVFKDKNWVVYRRNDFNMDILKKNLEEHFKITIQEPNVLVKKDKKSIVSRVRNGEETIFIKQFCYPRLKNRLFGFIYCPKGKRAWLGGNGLIVREIPSLTPLALLERRNRFFLKEEFLFMEAIENGLEMDRYILKNLNGIKLRRKFIKEFAQWLAFVHQRKIYHKDMKTCNILVRQNGNAWEFYLLDLEDIRFGINVNEKKLIKNLIQLNNSTPYIITKTNRLRFFKEYLRLRPLVSEKKLFIRELIKQSQKRDIVYVSSNGLIIER
jgi:tRNA A-37 threonylcarbamoyl transferase component Bud32